MNKLTLIAAALLLTQMPAAYAATASQIQQAQETADQINRQQQEQLQQQQEQLAPSKVPTGSELQISPALVENLTPADGNCYALNALKVEGATLLDEWEVEVLEVPFLDKCITPELVKGVIAKATDFYLQRGFVTTRAYLPNQNLKQGVLRIVIAEGNVGEVKIKGNAKGVNLVKALPIDKQEPLHIRDLEQAVDQLNAVPGNDVAMEIVPGDVADESNVVFTNHGEAKTKGTLSINNGGSEATGEDVVAVNFASGDIMGMSDVWTISATQTTEKSDRGATSFAVNVAVPDGYNTYGLGLNASEYHTTLTFPTTGTQMSSEGSNTGWNLSAKRVIARDQDGRHTVGANLARSRSQSYIGGQLVSVSSKTIDSLAFHSESALSFGNNFLLVKPQVEVGLSEVDNLPAGTNTPVQNPQAEYVSFNLTLDWSQPFAVAGMPMTWKSKFDYQYSQDELYGSQAQTIGGMGSVRGFKGVSLSGDKGYFWQNSLILNQELAFGDIAGTMEYTLGYDFGEVSSNTTGEYVGTLRGLMLGTNLKVDNWNLGVSFSKPLHASGTTSKGENSVLATFSLDI